MMESRTVISSSEKPEVSMSRRVEETEKHRGLHCDSLVTRVVAAGRGLKLEAASLEIAFADVSTGLDIMMVLEKSQRSILYSGYANGQESDEVAYG